MVFLFSFFLWDDFAKNDFWRDLIVVNKKHDRKNQLLPGTTEWPNRFCSIIIRGIEVNLKPNRRSNQKILIETSTVHRNGRKAGCHHLSTLRAIEWVNHFCSIFIRCIQVNLKPNRLLNRGTFLNLGMQLLIVTAGNPDVITSQLGFLCWWHRYLTPV